MDSFINITQTKPSIQILVLLYLLLMITVSQADEDLIFKNSFEPEFIATIAFITPATNQVVDQDNIITRVRVAASNQLQGVTVNDIQAQVTTQNTEFVEFTAQISLNQGDNTLTAIATYSDQTLSTQIQTRFIPIAQITITSPTDWQTLGGIGGAGGALDQSGNVQRPVTITGTITTIANISDVQINQQQADFDNNSFSFQDFFLHEGSNLLSINVTDEFDRQSSAQITVYVDQSAPFISVNNLNNRITSANHIDITGIVNDAIKADFNAPPVNVNISNLTTGNNYAAQVQDIYYLGANIPLAVGNNQLVITATDAYNNSRDITANVVRIAVGSNRITRFTGNNQSAPANTQLPQALIINAMDKNGLPLIDLPIYFDIIKGTATISSQQNSQDLSDGVNPARNLIINTNDSGQAQIYLTLGQQAGLANNLIRAYSPTLAEDVYFTATTLTGTPAQVQIEGASGTQYAQTNSQPVEALTIVVSDANNNPLANTPVIFTITEGDAHFKSNSSIGGQLQTNQIIQTITDNQGQASTRPYIGTSPSNIVITAKSQGENATIIGNARFNIIALQRSNQPTKLTGIVMDQIGIPLAGITFSIDRTNLTAISDDDGYFEFPSQVPTGKIDLFIDGRNVQAIQNGKTIEYPTLHFQTAIIQGQTNQLPHPIYLPPVHIENTQIVGADQDVTLTIPNFQGFKMIVKAGSVTFPDGSNIGELVVNPVHNDRLPMVPPGTAGRFMALGWSIQPTGTRFDPPIEVHIPNTDGLNPGTIVPIVQWDHDMAFFVPMGLGTISEDGSTLVTNPNSGITKAGWGGGPPAIAENEGEDGEDECEDSKNKKATSLTISANGVTGELVMDHIKDGTDILFQATIGGSCDAPSYNWSFGDESSSQEESPTHKYTESGEYNADLEVSCKSCEPISATYRVGLKCKLETIEGECIAEYGKTNSFNTDSNDPNRTEWKVEKRGNPSSFTGEPFDLIFNGNPNSHGTKSKLDAVCKAEFEEEEDIEISESIRIGRACSGYEPLINNIMTDNSLLPMPKRKIKDPIELKKWQKKELSNPDLFGLALLKGGPLGVRGCVSTSNQWEYRFVFPEYKDYGLVPTIQPRKIYLISPNDGVIDNSNCKKVLRDLTPRGPRIRKLGNIKKAPYAKYVPVPIIELHEATHVNETRALVIDQLFSEVQARAPQLQNSTSACGNENPYEAHRTWFNERVEVLTKAYEGSGNVKEYEKRAYILENQELESWRNQIKQRAQQNGWRNSCQ